MGDIAVKRLREGAILPTYGSAGAAGADLYACLEWEVTIPAGETAFIPTGIAMEVPVGCAGLVYARSGLACKKGLAPANKVGVIDSDYRGEIKVILINHGEEEFTINRGMRIAQMVIAPVLQAQIAVSADLSASERGAGGFGHSGK